MLFNGDCLEVMKKLDDDSVDFIFCDLPYGQTSCKWDIIIPWEPFWKEIMRIKKLNTPLFFTTTTKFGVELINNAPKKCPFRYDLVWVKSAPAGFLSAKKMPMRKHEMVYVFYEKLPLYDLSSHKHKFIKEKPFESKCETAYGKAIHHSHRDKVYDPPLPVSVVKEEVYDAIGEGNKNIMYNCGEPMKRNYTKKQMRDNLKDSGNNQYYDPPLPVSVVKEDKHTLYGDIEEKGIPHTTTYDPPLPTTMLEIKSTRGKHSTEKPVALMEWLLKYYSKEGDTVLDPTMGSGSTGVACKNMNRNFIGIEKDPEIFEVAKSRNPDELVMKNQ